MNKIVERVFLCCLHPVPVQCLVPFCTMTATINAYIGSIKNKHLVEKTTPYRSENGIFHKYDNKLRSYVRT